MKQSISILLAAALLLAACGDSSNEEEATNGAAEFDTELIPVGGAIPVGAAAVNGPAAPELGTAVGEADPVVEIREISDWFRAVVINPAAIASPLELEEIGRSICEGLTPCRAAMWFTAAEAATALPVTTEQVVSQVYAFGRSLEGNEVSQFNCQMFPEVAEEHSCLPRLLGGG